MRKLTVSTLALAMAMCATGCIMVIGTGRHVRTLPAGTHFVEIEGTAYVVDLNEGTVRAARASETVEEETTVEVETVDN